MEYLNIFFIDFLGGQVLIPNRSIYSSDPPLKFNQKYLHLCSKVLQGWYSMGGVINDLILIFGWTNPLNTEM